MKRITEYQDREMDVLIAESIPKYTRIEPLRAFTRKGKPDPKGVRIMWCESHHGGAGEYLDIPKFSKNRDAICEAIATLSGTERIAFSKHLQDATGYAVVGYVPDYHHDLITLSHLITTPPRQLAESYAVAKGIALP